MGSRFGVLASESDRVDEVVQQKDVAILAIEGRTRVVDTVESPRAGVTVWSRGKNGSKSNRKAKSKYEKKEKMGDVAGQCVQRIEKRSRGDEESEVGNSELGKVMDGKINLEVDRIERVSEQGKDEGCPFNAEETCSEKANLEGFVLDPGQVEPIVALDGRFWAEAEPDPLGPECSMVADSGDELMSLEGRLQAYALGAVCNRNKPCLLFLAETKTESVDRLRCVSRLGFDGMSYVPSVGRSGGILAAWNSTFVEVDVLQLDRQFIHLRCRYPNEDWFFVTALYAIPDNNHKQTLWNQLSGLASSMNMAWTVISDFNDIATPDERTGGIGGSALQCSLFSDRLQACNLMDIGAVGSKFTWRGPKLSNGRRLYERLDRVVSNQEFLSAFSEYIFQIIPLDM
ncbi:hypothetical protein K1719_017966 [Acacia pycnantha]|nr:hypothetical protein K1719_017966 [Acacia pycnantha]